MTVLSREDHTAPIVSTMLWYRVGSRCERPGVTGISHFLEHMMFKGTNRFPKGEIDYVTTRMGGANNAFTSNDYTAYYFTFASDRWWPALEIEADRMRNSLFEPEEFELERQVIIEEFKMDLDSPWGALRLAAETHSFEVHPYRFPVIGAYEDLVSITREQMLEYYGQFYAPNNAVLVVVGDFDTSQAVDRIEELFGSLELRNVPSEAAVSEPRHSRQIRLDLQQSTHVPRMLIALPAPSARHPDHYGLHLLDKIVGEGKLSRLYRRLVEEEEVASSVTSEFAETLDPYLFFIRAELLEGQDPARVEPMIFEEVARLAKEPAAEAELQRVKNQCVTQLLAGFETTLDQAMQLGLMETLDRYEYWHDYPERINRLTSEDLQAFAAKYWTPEQATVGILTDGSGTGNTISV